MSAKGNDSLSAKERALIEAARQTIGTKTTKPAPASISRPTSVPTQPATRPTAQAARPPVTASSSIKPDAPLTRMAVSPAIGAAERIALLMQTERVQTEARKKKLRLWGIYMPMGVLGLLVLWTAAAALKQVL